MLEYYTALPPLPPLPSTPPPLPSTQPKTGGRGQGQGQGGGSTAGAGSGVGGGGGGAAEREGGEYTDSEQGVCEHDPEIAEAALWAITNMACDLGLAKVTRASLTLSHSYIITAPPIYRYSHPY